MSDNYWSGTTNANWTDNAWIVNFNDGNMNNDNKGNGNYVRCVRQYSQLPSPQPDSNQLEFHVARFY